MSTRKVTRTIETTTKVEARISAAEIRALVGAPEHASIVVDIPGGGDWSSRDFEVEEVIVTWTATERKEEEG